MTENGSSEVDLSIVVPAFNEEQRLPASLSRIAAWLAARTPPLSAEVLVVDDGSADGTARVAQDSATPAFPLRVVRHDANRGKGAAVRTGVLASRGRWVLVTDADLCAELTETLFIGACNCNHVLLNFSLKSFGNRHSDWVSIPDL
ncbi:glycosyltransferase [Acidobacteria bacterium ACD]|nr:glycosyltransferase [Acidobacteria bacterium ACD]